MRRAFSISLLIGVITLALWASESEAFEAYSPVSGMGTSCVTCHGEFLVTNFSLTSQDPATWGGSLHTVHQGMVGFNCNVCHSNMVPPESFGKPVYLNDSNAGPQTAPAISCLGCHGRAEDRYGTDSGGNPLGDGAGLRQRHWRANVVNCNICHSEDSNPQNYTPVGEDFAPPWYSTLGWTACNGDGSETFAGSLGLDNDGDSPPAPEPNLYDTNDSDCPAPPGCTVDADCDDGIFCNGAETCDTGTGECQVGTPPCDDGVECTIDSCDEVNDVCVNEPDDTACPDDGLFCTGAPICVADQGCAFTGDPCPPNTVCNEDTDMCDPVGCTSDAECEDGDLCNGMETCNLDTGECVPGTPVDCTDDVDCTIDTCEPQTGACTHTPDDTVCDNGQFCDGAETCDADLGCQAGTPPCDPATEICNEDLDLCEPAGECTVDEDCDDNDACNGVETCVAGTCVGGTPVDCNDDVDCTVDTCDPQTGACTHTPDDTVCDNGQFCDGAETCDADLGCQDGTPPCDPATEICNEDLDQCEPAGGCTADEDCEDGLFCTINTCDTTTGLCGAITACPPAIMGCVILNDSCDEENDQCVDRADDTLCDDGVFCNGAETCDIDTGACLPGTPPDCDDGIDCTIDSCDLAADACVNTPDDAACPDDGLFCTGEPICDAAMGCGFTGDPCPEGTVCNEDTDSCDTVAAERVTLCHKGKNTITVGAAAVAAHLRHGDTLGPCPDLAPAKSKRAKNRRRR